MRPQDGPVPEAWSIDIPEPRSTIASMPMELRWSDDGTRILVTRTVDPRLFPALDAARPDIGAALVVVGFAVLVLGAVRVLRRPRVAGRSYCRRCNHDLDTASGEHPRSAQCPECGLSTAGRGIVPGRGLARRLARVAVASLAISGCGAALFFVSIGNGPGPFGLPAWPVAAAAETRDWLFWRTCTADTPSRLDTRIEAIQIRPEGLSMGRYGLIPEAAEWVPRPDGTAIAWAYYFDTTEWSPCVAWVDLATGRGGSVAIGEADSGYPIVCGWTPNGREIVALLVRLNGSYPRCEDGTAIVAMDMMAIDPASRTVRSIGIGRGRAVEDTPNSWFSGPATTAVGTDAGARIVTLVGERVLLSSYSPGGVVLRDLWIVGDAHTREVPLSGELLQTWHFRRSWITADGKLGVELAGYPSDPDAAPQGGPELFIDLATGAITHPASTASPASASRPDAGKPSPDGTRRARLQVDQAPDGSVARLRVTVTPG